MGGQNLFAVFVTALLPYGQAGSNPEPEVRIWEVALPLPDDSGWMTGKQQVTGLLPGSRQYTRNRLGAV